MFGSFFFIFYELGYCAEFDINAAVVQENYNADCKTHDPSCPEYYDSSEAYKCKSTPLILSNVSYSNLKIVQLFHF